MSGRNIRGRKRKTAFLEPKAFVLVAMEGAETEPRYFELFRKTRESNIQYKPVSNPNHKSNPLDVFERLKRAFKDYDIKKDEGWIVIDRDAWEEGVLNELCRKAKANSFHVALSNPCFELWLYLHLHENVPFADRHDCQQRLEDILENYTTSRKGRFDLELLREGVEVAIKRALALDIYPDLAWPKTQCTRVYKLVQSLMRDE